VFFGICVFVCRENGRFFVDSFGDVSVAKIGAWKSTKVYLHFYIFCSLYPFHNLAFLACCSLCCYAMVYCLNHFEAGGVGSVGQVILSDNLADLVRSLGHLVTFQGGAFQAGKAEGYNETFSPTPSKK